MTSEKKGSSLLISSSTSRPERETVRGRFCDDGGDDRGGGKKVCRLLTDRRKREKERFEGRQTKDKRGGNARRGLRRRASISEREKKGEPLNLPQN